MRGRGVGVGRGFLVDWDCLGCLGCLGLSFLGCWVGLESRGGLDSQEGLESQDDWGFQEGLEGQDDWGYQVDLDGRNALGFQDGQYQKEHQCHEVEKRSHSLNEVCCQDLLLIGRDR